MATTSSGLIISNKLKLELEASKRFSHDDSPKYFHHGDKWPKKLVFKNYTLSNKFPNNVCLMKDGSVVVCANFKYRDNSLFLIGQTFHKLDCPFRKPYVATDFHIYRASDVRASYVNSKPCGQSKIFQPNTMFFR